MITVLVLIIIKVFHASVVPLITVATLEEKGLGVN